MRVDLHNHTILCNHADGTVEEYIKKAVEIGIDIFGFTDHAPMSYDPKYRMDIIHKEFYENNILYLKKKYESEIEILLGYEVDFMQKIPMLPEIINAKVDYLIGSIHFLEPKIGTTVDNEPWGFDNPEFIGKYESKDIDQIWADYFDVVELLAKSNKFDVVGHLDLIKVFKFLPKRDIKSIALNALKQIKKSNMVLEVNSAGLRKPIAQPYPSKELLQVAYDLDIPITFASDAHSVEQIGFGYEDVTKLAKDIGYTQCAIFRNRDRELVTF